MINLPVKESGELGELLKSVRSFNKVSAFGMPQNNRVITAKMLGRCVYVCADFITARNVFTLFSDLSDRAVMLPAKDDVLIYHKSRSGENAVMRFKALKAICENKADFIITTADALTQLYPIKEKFAARIIKLVKGEQYNIYDLAACFADAGYKRETQVSAPGQFSVRGDILDIWSIDSASCFRVDFFDDEAENIRLFDVSEQVTRQDVNMVEVCPNTEMFLSENEAAEVLVNLKAEYKKSGKGGQAVEWSQALENAVSDLCFKLESGERDITLSYIMPLTKHCCLFEFADYPFVYDDAKSVVDGVKMAYTEHYSRYKSDLERKAVLPLCFNQLVNEDTVFAKSPVSALAFHSLNSANRIFNPTKVFNFTGLPIPNYTRDYQALVTDVKNWWEQGIAVHLYCTESLLKSIEALFTDHRISFKNVEESEVGAHKKLDISVVESNYVYLHNSILSHGAIFFEQSTVLIGTYDIARMPAPKTLKRSKQDVFSEPKVGDFVVHNVHGIGVCDEITKLDVGGISRDYVVIRYAGGDKLYVPIENMDSLTRFVSGEESPKLSKIGGADFELAKEKVRKSVKAMAINLLELYAARSKCEGYKYSDDNSLLDEFGGDFPYDETADQLTAIEEGVKDLTSGKVMDRLLCGDVGYGKTEVALRIAFKVIAEGKQVAFIAPTTILARQHYNTCVKRFERFGINIASLTRFDNPARQKADLERLESGRADIVCGTHRTLSKDVIFKDLGLLILDEEQRFGVADKEKIKKLKNSVNVLSLSATPIPRTLHMSMVGIRDISILDTPPSDRIPIQTYVTEFTPALCVDAINREVNRGGQVFVVYNRVAEINKLAASLASMMPDIKFVVAHGQMPEKNLENVITGFVAGEADVLVASTIIENGMDIAMANTMIVIDSDHLGLSQLYQLRGRVGRSNRLSYVYFTFDGAKILTETAYKRLEAITQFTDFGSGFKIAMRDLEIRGAGNILGREQHGHIEKVGYDMYCKLLEGAVAELKGETVSENVPEVKVITDFNAYIPTSYVADNEWRVRLYGRIARLKSLEERAALMSDVTDIYGKVPDCVANLLMIGLIKNLSVKLNALSVTLKKKECFVTVGKIKELNEEVIKAIGNSREVKLDANSSRIIFENPKGMIKFLISCQ